jgi:hypothetical protein
MRDIAAWAMRGGAAGTSPYALQVHLLNFRWHTGGLCRGCMEWRGSEDHGHRRPASRRSAAPIVHTAQVLRGSAHMVMYCDTQWIDMTT